MEGLHSGAAREVAHWKVNMNPGLSPTKIEGVRFPKRLGIQQRVLPAYRVPFFDRLAEACDGGLGVFAGEAGPGETIHQAAQLAKGELSLARNHHIGQLSSPFYLCWQSGWMSWLNSWQPDVLIVEANPRYLSTRLGVTWMRAHQRPVLGWGLGAPGTYPQAGQTYETLRRPGRQRFFAQFDGMIAYSQQGAESYRQAGFPAERVFVAINSVTPRPEDPEPPRREPLTGNLPRVLFVGRLQARKRIDLLLKACAALPAALQPRLWIAGEGPEEGSLRELAAEIYPETVFLGGVYGDALTLYFQQADLFVLPGTGGLAVQQAMSFGLPVIVAEGDGTLEDLVRPENGWRIAPGSFEELEHSLLTALANREQLRTMGAESYRIVREEANLEMMVAAFVNAANQIHVAYSAPK